MNGKDPRDTSRFWHLAKIWAYVLIFLYSSLRALPLMFVDEFHGSIFVIWLIDIVTALPYTWGIIAFIASPRKLQRYCGFFIALGTFAAPYIYFWTHGDTYPLGVIAIVVAMMIGGVGLEVYRYLRHKYRSSHQKLDDETP